jgi:amino acid permease (GABA permease)
MTVGTRPESSASVSDDVQRLHELGYAQELLRRMGGFSNFAVSFTIISVLSGCLTLYYYGMNTGGPVSFSIGWPIVGVLVTIVGLAMAEICSSYPTAGGLYYWAAKLGGRNAPVWSWYAGWFNLLGQVAVTAGIDFGLAFSITAELNLLFGYGTKPLNVLAILAVVLVLHGLLNTFGIRVVALLNDVSVWWHLLGVVIIVGALFLIPSHHQSLHWVFTHYVNNTGWSSKLYVLLLGLLVAQYTFTGYDASAHLSEETTDAAITAPRGIVMSIIVSLVAGWILLIGVTAAIQHYNAEMGSLFPPAQIFIDGVGLHGGELLMLIVIGAQFFCGMSSVTANSRMLYAFSRDGAVPGSATWHHINPRTRTPTNSIWFCTVGAFILAAPYYFNATAYAAVTSIAVIGLYIAYVIPVFLRRIHPDDFVQGPWNLGRWSAPIGWISVVWVVIITVLFMLPAATPITRDNFNYTVVAVGFVFAFATIYWFASARNWFKGPRVQGSAEELARIERELIAVGTVSSAQ